MPYLVREICFNSENKPPAGLCEADTETWDPRGGVVEGASTVVEGGTKGPSRTFIGLDLRLKDIMAFATSAPDLPPLHWKKRHMEVLV